MSDLSSMPNIGKEIEKKLIEVNINTQEELISCGSKEAFLRIKNIDHSACYNMLCALEGAIQGMRWHGLSIDTKKELKSFIDKVDGK